MMMMIMSSLPKHRPTGIMSGPSCSSLKTIFFDHGLVLLGRECLWGASPEEALYKLTITIMSPRDEMKGMVSQCPLTGNNGPTLCLRLLCGNVRQIRTWKPSVTRHRDLRFKPRHLLKIKHCSHCQWQQQCTHTYFTTYKYVSYLNFKSKSN